MKIALLGAGRTGSKVVKVAKSHNVTVFTQSNPPTAESLAGHDVVISFLPGDAFLSYLDMLIESEIPVVTGSTGFEWPENIQERLQSENLAWVTASIFAPGMFIAKAMLEVLSKASDILPNVTYHMHEIHHVTKRDSPSAAAKSWAEWLGHPVDIESDREGDTVGVHTMTMDSTYETIVLNHVSKDREVFAAGAIWTAEYVMSNELKPGLHHLSDIMQKELGL